MLITPYIPTGRLWKRRSSAGSMTFAGRVELTPELIAAAQADGSAAVYIVPNEKKTNPRAHSVPDFVLYVASQPIDSDTLATEAVDES